MTKDEFRRFVEQAIMDQNMDWMMGPYVDKIIAQWEKDIEEAHQHGIDAGAEGSGIASWEEDRNE